jgi:hypothetical protein
MSAMWTRVISLLKSRVGSLLVAAGVGAVLVVAAQVVIRYLRPAAPSQVLAVVDGQPITLPAFQREVLKRGGETSFSAPEQRRALLDDMIRVAVLSSNAQKAGLTAGLTPT